MNPLPFLVTAALIGSVLWIRAALRRDAMPALPDGAPPGGGAGGPGSDAFRQPLFDVRGLTKAFGEGRWEVRVLNGVSLKVGRSLTAIVGPSGGGKSTFLQLLAGLDRPTTGELLFEGRPLPRREGAELRRHRRRVAYLHQDFNLVSHLTAEENVALPLLLDGVPRDDALARARRQLEAVDLSMRMDRKPRTLSGGERQRVALARAFVQEAAVVLADEPTASLDAGNAQSVMRILAELARRNGRPVVLVTHDLGLARAHTGVILECRKGRINGWNPSEGAAPATAETPDLPAAPAAPADPPRSPDAGPARTGAGPASQKAMVPETTEVQS